MATLNIRDENKVMQEAAEIREFLAKFGIWYRRFEGGDSLGANPSNDEILAAYAAPIEELKTEGGFVTADVVNITPETPGIEEMLAKFDKEHWHDEDEVRFIVHGEGLFHIHPENGPVFSIEVHKGDMINVPRGTLHWFHLSEKRTVRAIRLFQDPAGWTPHYTETGLDAKYEPVFEGQ